MPEISLGVSKIFFKCYISPGKNMLWLSYCFGPIASAVSKIKFGDSSYHSVIQLLLWVLVRHCSVGTRCLLVPSVIQKLIKFIFLWFFLSSTFLPPCLSFRSTGIFSSHVQHSSARNPLLFVLVEEQLGHCHGHHLQPHTAGFTEPSTGSPGRFFCQWPAVNVLPQWLFYVL